MFVYYKCYIMIGLTFWKESMLIKQMYQKSAMSVAISIVTIVLSFNQMYAIDALIY